MSDALAAIYPRTTMQTCIVHLLRHSLADSSLCRSYLISSVLIRVLPRRDLIRAVPCASVACLESVLIRVLARRDLIRAVPCAAVACLESVLIRVRPRRALIRAVPCASVACLESVLIRVLP